MPMNLSPQMQVLKADVFDPIVAVRLVSETGMQCEVSNLGAAMHRLYAPDRNGALENVVLGYSSVERYAEDPFFMGATVGRVANRIENGRFALEGRSYELERNNGPHHLHGGSNGFYRKVWKTTPLDGEPGSGVLFSLHSPDGDAGYPGAVEAEVSYLLRGNELDIVMTATSSALTPINLAHHSYFHLGGGADVLDHEVTIFADAITPGAPVVPSGELREVAGTEFDLRTARAVGAALPMTEGAPRGFDHNYLLRVDPEATPTFAERDELPSTRACGRLFPAAVVHAPRSGRTMSLATNQPALQFYSGNYLDGRAGVPRALTQYAGLCLETQAVPNFINLPQFAEQGTLLPGRIYRHEMRLCFSTEPR